MKNNIDLTLNREFRKHKKFKKNITKLLPWNSVKHVLFSIDDITNMGNKGLVRTGDADERKSKALSELYYLECERCGTKLNKIPWHHEIGLCSRCKKELEKDVVKGRQWDFRRRKVR